MGVKAYNFLLNEAFSKVAHLLREIVSKIYPVISALCTMKV